MILPNGAGVNAPFELSEVVGYPRKALLAKYYVLFLSFLQQIVFFVVLLISDLVTIDSTSHFRKPASELEACHTNNIDLDRLWPLAHIPRLSFDYPLLV